MIPRGKYLKRYGRYIVAGILVAYCALFVLFYLGIPEPLRDRWASGLMLGIMWSTILLGAMWYGQNWARYIFIFVLSATMVLTISFLFSTEAHKLEWPTYILVLSSFPLHFGTIFTLVCSPPIRALVDT